MTIQLFGPDGTTYATTTFSVTSTSSKFTYVSTTFSSSQSPSGNNKWQLTFDAQNTANGGLNFGLVQLFPVTYHTRFNGIRNDIAAFVEKIGGSFLRFPGGNNLQGKGIASRWKWNETIGPVENRPGRMGTWSYANTDALGLMEYMQWTEDMGLEAVLVVWSGHSLDGSSVTGVALDPYVTDILNELEFLLGSTGTTYGALRSSYGRSDPYTVNYVEVGNEDHLSGGCDTYASRFLQIYDAVHAAYPDITVIASTANASCLPNPVPFGIWLDAHHYYSPDMFISSFGEFDHQSRSQPILIGEYASSRNNDWSRRYREHMQASCAEAVYMIGLERNSDVVKMACYAPLLEHFGLADFRPNLFGFNSTPGSMTGSTSYYVQKMFATNRGTTIRPVSADSNFGPLYWVASSTSSNGYVVKLANYGNSTQSVTVKVPGASTNSAKLQLLSGPATTSNSPFQVDIRTRTSAVSGSASGGYTFSMPAYAVAVLLLSQK